MGDKAAEETRRVGGDHDRRVAVADAGDGGLWRQRELRREMMLEVGGGRPSGRRRPVTDVVVQGIGELVDRSIAVDIEALIAGAPGGVGYARIAQRRTAIDPLRRYFVGIA
jgi:hypothetical protein